MGIHQAANQLEQTKIDLKPRIGLLIIGIILIGANLRAPLTSVGPLVTSIDFHSAVLPYPLSKPLTRIPANFLLRLK